MTPSQKSQGFFATYKKVIIAAVIGIVLTGSGTFTVFIHNAYADGRYVQKTNNFRQQIQQIDNALFEIDQEISFAIDERERRKWIARKAYYLRLKEALKEQLRSNVATVTDTRSGWHILA